MHFPMPITPKVFFNFSDKFHVIFLRHLVRIVCGRTSEMKAHDHFFNNRDVKLRTVNNFVYVVTVFVFSGIFVFLFPVAKPR